MKTRCKVTCDLEKVSYTDKRKNYSPYIFCNERLDIKPEKCHVATQHVDSIFLAIVWFSLKIAPLLTRFEDLTSVGRLKSVKRLKCVALLARLFSLRGVVPLTSVEPVKSALPVMKVYPLRSAVVAASVESIVHLTSVASVKSVN